MGLSSGPIVKPYAAAAKIPIFCICSVGSVADELYALTIMPLAEDEAMQRVAEAKRRDIKRIARLTQDYPSIDNHVRPLKEEAAKAGIDFVYEGGFAAATTGFSSRIAAQGFESSEDVLTYVRRMTEYSGTAGKIIKEAGTGNFRSAPAVWVIKNGKPTLSAVRSFLVG